MALLDGKVAIVTGGANGIGAAIARRYAENGARVIINDYGVAPDGTGSDNGAAAAVVEEIKAAGGEAVADFGDIGDTATGKRLVDLAVSTYGRLDIVANPAGFLRDRMIFNLSDEDWDQVVRVHLRGHFSVARPAAAYWRSMRNPEANYRFISFTSRSGLDGSPGQPNYAAAKLGVVGLTYSLAQGLGRYGVTANSISPSAATRLIDTVPADKKFAKPTDNDPQRSSDNIATVALYLATDRSRWLTARVLHASGYDVGLYNNPEIVRQVSTNQPWNVEELSSQIEANFKPFADGLPFSVFQAQMPTKG